MVQHGVIVLLLCILLQILDLSYSYPAVTISQGTLRGFTVRSDNAKAYDVFLGIPFGKINKRFEVAESADNWDGTRDSTQFGSPCIQPDFPNEEIIGSEDCLFLNIYTNNLNAKLPTFVWIHGGGWLWGSGEKYDPSYIMKSGKHDVVVVTINYRLGSMGFLSTGDSIISGNFGMKDQVLALSWIKANIANFGGDPERITIAGNSAGGSSTHMHYFSPLSKGLFSSGISQSGVATCCWSFENEPLKQAKRLAETVGCNTTLSTAQMIEFLRSKDAKDLIEAENTLTMWYDTSPPFLPVIEQNSPTAFLTEPIDSLISSGKMSNKVPWITGITPHETIYDALYMLNDNDILKKLNSEWSTISPLLLSFDHIRCPMRRGKVIKEILSYYLKDKEFGPDTLYEFTDLMSDRALASCTFEAAKMQSKHSPVYYPYMFKYPGMFSFAKMFSGIAGPPGTVCHMDELQYLFNQTYGSTEFKCGVDSEQIEFSRNFINLWLSFIKTGEPKDTWTNDSQSSKPIWPLLSMSTSDDISEWFTIDKDKTGLEKNEDMYKRLKFWRELPIDKSPMGSHSPHHQHQQNKDEL